MDILNDESLHRFIADALSEDIGPGDYTSLACVPDTATGKAKLLAKDDGIVAGVAIAEKIFHTVDPDAVITVLIPDGSPIKKGDIVFTVTAKSQAILKAERLVLNTMQRLSGVATLSRAFADAVKDYPVQILDTRKTTPLLRFLEKWAVRVGGCTNYRTGLYDRIMIKDNHVDFCGSIPLAIAKVKAYLAEHHLDLLITLEVRNLDELQQALDTGGIHRIMFDNFTPELMKSAVAMVNNQYETEASGGITLSNIHDYAATGVNFISVGALTHSFRSLDLSLKKTN